MRKRRLRLVQPNPGFDLNKFRTKRSFEAETEAKAPARRRPPGRMMGKFVQVPYVWADRLREHRISGVTWYLLVKLDQLIHEPGKSNPIKLSTEALKSMGLGYWEAYRALCQLERAGAVAVTRHSGRTPVVDLLWYWNPPAKVTQISKDVHAN